MKHFARSKSVRPLAARCRLLAFLACLPFLLGGRAALAEALACAGPTANCPLVADLLARREGYGRAATGGLGGRFVSVTSAADDGPGSLREALRSGGQPVWITFAADLTIELKSQLRVPSNVTIDGRGHMILLNDYGLGLYQQATNIIVESLTIDGRFRTVSQAINISGDVRQVWLDHLDLSRFIDRLVNVKRGSTDVTISWVKFHDHNKVMLLNNQIGPDIFADFQRDSESRVTIHHSYFVDTVQRNPRAQFGTYEIYNNLLENWDFYGMSFGLEAKALVQGNMFINRRERPCVEPDAYETVEGVTRNYCHALGNAGARAILPNGYADQKRYESSKATYAYTHDYRAFLRVRDNLFIGAADDVGSYRPELAPELPSCSTYEAPSEALAARIRKEAGNVSGLAQRGPTCRQ